MFLSIRSHVSLVLPCSPRSPPFSSFSFVPLRSPRSPRSLLSCFLLSRSDLMISRSVCWQAPTGARSIQDNGSPRPSWKFLIFWSKGLCKTFAYFHSLVLWECVKVLHRSFLHVPPFSSFPSFPLFYNRSKTHRIPATLAAADTVQYHRVRVLLSLYTIYIFPLFACCITYFHFFLKNVLTPRFFCVILFLRS